MCIAVEGPPTQPTHNCTVRCVVAWRVHLHHMHSPSNTRSPPPPPQFPLSSECSHMEQCHRVGARLHSRALSLKQPPSPYSQVHGKVCCSMACASTLTCTIVQRIPGPLPILRVCAHLHSLALSLEEACRAVDCVLQQHCDGHGAHTTRHWGDGTSHCFALTKGTVTHQPGAKKVRNQHNDFTNAWFRRRC
jgi:hypothetical protein